MTIYHIPAQFTASRVGVDGLTVTWSVDRVTRADGTRSALVTDAANAVTYGRFGLYGYLLDMDLETYDYLVTAKSTSAIVDMKELTTFWTSTETEAISAISTYLSVFVAKSSEVADVLTAVNAIPTPTANVAVTAANAATLAAGNVAFLSYAHTNQVITSTSTEDLSSATKVWFALKDLYSETDAQSLIFIEKTAGLTHVGKSAIVSPIVTTDGSLTVSGSSGAWVFTVVLKSEAAALLSDYAGSRKLGEIKATIGGLDKVIGTVTGAINSGVIRTNA